MCGEFVNIGIFETPSKIAFIKLYTQYGFIIYLDFARGKLMGGQCEDSYRKLPHLFQPTLCIQNNVSIIKNQHGWIINRHPTSECNIIFTLEYYKLVSLELILQMPQSQHDGVNLDHLT